MRFTLAAEAEYCLNKLHEAGHKAYIVGGPVRSLLLNTEPQDWDITTDARPEEVQAVFSCDHVIETGLKHGTVTVLVKNQPIEITTFRTEGTYSDHRRPDSVNFTNDLTQDLARRDFTINAMAYNHQEGLIDPYEGISDLEAGIIRAVGVPAERFREDALRILRALRFASVLGFEIESATADAIFEQANDLQHIAAERIKVEFEKLLCGKNAVEILRQYHPVIGVFLPELLPLVGFEQHNVYHSYDVFEHTLHALAATPPIPVLRWTVLMHDFGKPRTFTMGQNGVGHFYGHPGIGVDIAAEIMNRLKFSKAEQQQILPLVRYHDIRIQPTLLDVKRWMKRLGAELFKLWLSVKRADISGQNPDKLHRLKDVDKMEELYEGVLASGDCFRMADLKISGVDIINLGVAPGPQVGAILELLLEKVIADELPNDNEELLKATEELLNQPEFSINTNKK